MDLMKVDDKLIVHWIQELKPTLWVGEYSLHPLDVTDHEISLRLDKREVGESLRDGGLSSMQMATVIVIQLLVVLRIFKERLHGYI